MNLFHTIAELLTVGESLVVAVIVSQSGSAPRAAGTRMAIRRDASIVGTIGGGILEAQVRDLAREVFHHGKAVLRDFTLTAEDAGRTGMICGGELEILVHLVDGSIPSHLEFHRAVLTALREKERAWLITGIPAGGESGIPPAQSLYRQDGFSTGAIDRSRLEEIVALAGTGQSETVRYGGRRYFVEPLYPEGTVFIFGAGHISQVLAPLTKLVGFRTVVLDDREEFANRDRFADADRIVVPDAIESAFHGLDVDEGSYVVLVTRGHSHDKVLLRQALKGKAGYIGMIGSRRKRNAIYEALMEEGFTARDFERVSCPIGLDIGAETPEEIAVSILAELIRKRAERKG